MKKVRLLVDSIKETKQLAQRLAKRLKGSEVICLIGDLGSGKTYFTKFLVEALGVKGEEIVSPTFVYWRKYKGAKFNINHFDFYRISSEDEIEDIGFEEALYEDNTVTIIEWADRIRSHLPDKRLEIYIKELGEEKREFVLGAFGEGYGELVNSK